MIHGASLTRGHARKAGAARVRALLQGAAATVLVGTLAAAYGGAAGAKPPPPPSSQGILQNRLVPDTPLVDSFGHPTSLAAYRDKYIVLANFLSLCQDECPLVTGAFIALQRDVRAAGLAKQVVFLEITVDPGRDTPDRLRAYSSRFGARWPLLTGTPENLAQLWNFFHIAYQIVPEDQPPKIDWYTGTPLTYDVAHTDGFILIDRRGHERFIDVNAPNLHGKLAKKLTNLLNDQGKQNLVHPQGSAWTLGDVAASLSWLVGKNIRSISST